MRWASKKELFINLLKCVEHYIIILLITYITLGGWRWFSPYSPSTVLLIHGVGTMVRGIVLCCVSWMNKGYTLDGVTNKCHKAYWTQNDHVKIWKSVCWKLNSGMRGLWWRMDIRIKPYGVCWKILWNASEHRSGKQAKMKDEVFKTKRT